MDITASDDSPRRPDLPGYDVLDLLGTGATGAVWAVRGPDGVRFAAKVLDATPDQLDYELSVLESVRHDHVVRVQDVVADRSTDPAGTAMVMQLAEGGSLADTLSRRDVLTPGELVTVLCPVARALHDLHGLGLIHGDLSPGNILLTSDGKPLIADLGMSRLAGHAGEEVWATEAWAAPEVLAGARPVPASDVYSLGAIAWRALTGAAPEPAALRPQLADLAPEISDELRDLVDSALAHTDSARPLPGEFAIRLWQCATPEPAPVQGSPARRTAAAAAAPGNEGNEGDALTRRIRAQAAADRQAAPAGPVPVGRRLSPRARWLLAGAAVLGAGLALGVTGLGGGSDGPARSASTTPLAGPTAQAGTASREARASATRPRARASTARTTAAGGPAAGSAQALEAHTMVIVQRLATARATAWARGDQGSLRSAEVVGSPAYRRDSADLRAAATRRVRYDGLTFTVRSATVRQATGDVVHVVARIDRSAYHVVVAGHRRSVRAATGQRTDLSIRWTGSGWRVVDWAQPA